MIIQGYLYFQIVNLAIQFNLFLLHAKMFVFFKSAALQGTLHFHPDKFDDKICIQQHYLFWWSVHLTIPSHA